MMWAFVDSLACLSSSPTFAQSADTNQVGLFA